MVKRKIYFKYLALAVILLSIFTFDIKVFSASSLSKSLPKTKETISKDKAKSDPKKDKDSKSKKDKKEDVISEEDSALADDIEEKSDPSKVFKLIAIYLIGNKPRVLLKNLSTPDDPAKEYQLGDFLDDSQTISISMINFNPTARIEITDVEGISYILKPQSEDSMSAPSGTSMVAPTYFSTGKAKQKRSGTTPPSPVTPPPPAQNSQQTAPPPTNPGSSPQPQAEQQVKKEEGSTTPPASAPAQSSPAEAQVGSGSGTSQSLKTINADSSSNSAPPPAPADNSPKQQPPPAMGGSDTTRPSNPFE